MAVINAGVIDRTVSAIAACAYLQELFEEAQQGEAGSALICAVMAMCFVPGILNADPEVAAKKTDARYYVAGKAICALFIYALAQGILDEWQHARLGGTILIAFMTAFFVLCFYYGSGRRGPWDEWLLKRRDAKIARQLARWRHEHGVVEDGGESS